jgi:SAM-dependent methyltransferase
MRAKRTTTDDAPIALRPRVEIPFGVRLNIAVNGVRHGSAVPDRTFDMIYPADLRDRSARYWTPIDVARAAARMLVTTAFTRVLDVGSGAGKFCTVGALTTAGHFTGIEQRASLVDLAKSIARRYGIPRASYLCADICDIEWQHFDAFYCFNPFAENTFDPEDRFDQSVELSAARRARDLAFVHDALASVRVGARLVTYHGLGCALPSSWNCEDRRFAGSDTLDLWVKVR